VKALVLQI